MTGQALISPRFRELEVGIERSAIGIGEALEEIKRTGMWKEHGTFASFADYLRGRWGIGSNYANKVIRAAQVRAELEPSTVGSGGTPVPANEAQARELLRSDDPVRVWQGVVAGHAPEEITAALVREHVLRDQPVVIRPSRYLESFVDSSDATRVQISNDGIVSIAAFDTDTWSPTDEAHLDIMGLRALAALALMIAEELEQGRPS